ncbi:MAG: hypothetical protein WA004_21340 [Saprospiraceae bacterium]
MALAEQSSQKLSALQLELKNILARFFAHRFAEKAGAAAKARNISDKDLDKWLEEDGQ